MKKINLIELMELSKKNPDQFKIQILPENLNYLANIVIAEEYNSLPNFLKKLKETAIINEIEKFLNFYDQKISINYDYYRDNEDNCIISIELSDSEIFEAIDKKELQKKGNLSSTLAIHFQISTHTTKMVFYNLEIYPDDYGNIDYTYSNEGLNINNFCLENGTFLKIMSDTNLNTSSNNFPATKCLTQLFNYLVRYYSN